MAEHVDATIIGGGPGGATAALMLARAGWRVAVIEKARFPRRKVCGEYVSATNLPLFHRLGLADDFLKYAGPPVREVGLFARETVLTAPMPQPGDSSEAWGRALGREVLDTLLLDRAAAAGARVWQPWSATKLRRQGERFLCEVIGKERGRTHEFCAPTVIAAHGSWEPGPLPTQPIHRARRVSDLFGFKAHFRGGRLSAGLMPLLVFPGGYGGMVHTNDGRVSLSVCLRRDRLERCRRRAPGLSAAEAAWAHVQESCQGAREALAGARREGAWLSAGPIAPGIRGRFSRGIFGVGNAAGEAHPIIAEGISMAVQSACLLCEGLLAGSKEGITAEALRRIGSDYAAAWRRSFAPRIRAAALFAHLAMSPLAVELLRPWMRLFPAALTLGAQWSGKTKTVTGAFGQADAHRTTG